MAKSAREAYEQAVSDLTRVSEKLRADGKSEEAIARVVVDFRNDLKRVFRGFDPPAAVVLMERRNLAKYGHPLGPDAEWLFARYGNWKAVIAAACRPAHLSDDL